MKALIRKVIRWSGIEVIRGVEGPMGMAGPMGMPGRDCQCKCEGKAE